MGGQAGDGGNLLAGQIPRFRLGIRILIDLSGITFYGLWCQNNRRIFVSPKKSHPVLSTLAFEDLDVALVVANVPKQLSPDRPYLDLSPTPKGFHADFPAQGQLLFGHCGVAHFLLHGRCSHDNAII